MLSDALNSTPSNNVNYQKMLHVYRSLCVVLDDLNYELKTEPVINGVSGPIPVTWQKR